MADSVKMSVQEVTVQKLYGKGDGAKEESENDYITILTYPPGIEVGHATMGMRYTLNMGNYESTQVYVEFSVPTVKEELEDAAEYVSDIVSEKMNEVVNDIRKLRDANK